MPKYVLNFPRSGVSSIIETLGLEGVEEIVLNDFFDDRVYKILKTMEIEGDVRGGGYC